jgi:hypothetical protein
MGWSTLSWWFSYAFLMVQRRYFISAAIAAGLAKTFALGERERLRFEATFTNLLNHPNFAPPAMDVSAPATFGQITTVQSAENAGNRTGKLTLRLDS